MGSFFPKIGHIIPKLTGVIVCKNPDVVTISGNVFLYYAITYPVICVLFIMVFCTLGHRSFLHKHEYSLIKIKPKETKQTRSIDSFFCDNEKEETQCEVECQTHGDDTDSVATLIESCKTELSWIKIIQHSLSRI